MTKTTGMIAGAAFAFAFAIGCKNVTPKYLTVGPDYEAPAAPQNLDKLPDAGYPTTNKTETGECKAAEGAADARARITGETLEAWWTRFDDPILTNLVASAISNNLSFLIAQQRLEQARWTYFGSAAPLLPQLDFGGTALHKEAHRNNSSLVSSHKTYGTRATHTSYYQAGFDASWEIDVFGGKRREVEAAGALMEQAEYTLADAWVSLTAEIGRTYLALRTAQQRLAVARANLKLQSETYDILKSRLDSGIGDELAVNQAKYNVEQTRATIPNILAIIETHMNALAILAGTMPGALHATLAELPARDWLEAPQKLDALPVDLVRDRPDVRAVERALAAQVAHVGVAKSLLYPRFFINGTLGLESVKIQKFLQPGSLYSTIGPSVSWPIFQGGNIVANVKIEEAKMEEALLKYENTVDAAIGEVRNAYSDYTQEYHRFQSLQGAVKAAKDAVSISQDLYKNGLADFNNVLDAQRSLLTLEEALTISRGQISIHLVALYKSLGGGLARAQ